METRVVNLRKEPFDVKVCRNRRGEVPDPPESGCFGNPFKMEQYGRDECIRLFREYFLERVEKDAVFREAVLSLRGKRLGCFCKPQECHADTIKEWLDGQTHE